MWISIFDNSNNFRQFPAPEKPYSIPRSNSGNIAPAPVIECASNVPSVNYAFGEYRFEVELPINEDGYTVSSQTCCWPGGGALTNVISRTTSPPDARFPGTGTTYYCVIPGTNTLPRGEMDSSPRFNFSTSVICQNRPFQATFGAADSDGDSLVYYFSNAVSGSTKLDAQPVHPATPIPGTPPRYPSLDYGGGYSPDQPMGPAVTINRRTGLISGVAPRWGNYLICVVVDVYRRGKLISFHRVEFIINVIRCDLAGADLPLSTSVCDSSGIQFENLNKNSLNKTFLWSFGDGNTSTQPRPFHTYKDTGIYVVKLTVNPGGPCTETDSSQAIVFPGLKPAFDVQGVCVNKPTRFIDRTTTPYGQVVKWLWRFGDNAALFDTSILQNPTFTYEKPGPRTVSLTAVSDKGCVSTSVFTDVITIIDKAVVDLAFKDTLICKGDPLQLRALGQGVFNWTSAAAITNANTATPTVQPTQTTDYFVELDTDGCTNSDTVRVRVAESVTLSVSPDTTICVGDTIRLRSFSDALKFKWTPTNFLSSDTAANPFAFPSVPTTYNVNAFIGPNCPVANQTVTVTTAPYPVADAGPDTTICFRTPAQLNATMVADRFVWSPAGTLLNSTTLSPTAKPVNTTRYVLTVYNNRGCPKPARDTVLVTVLPKIPAFAGRDKAVVEGQLLRLNASGGVRYVWSPASNLSATNIANPTAVYNNAGLSPITYTVQVFSEAGCVDSASVKVRFFNTKPSVFVPSAFSPNGDGLNDVLRPLAVGMGQIKHFRIFNRLGQLVFQTTDNGAGWDGRINSGDQGSNVYVWVVEAIDYTGKKFTHKGTVTLIR